MSCVQDPIDRNPDMARSDQDDFDGYRKWLGISNKKRLRTL